MMTKRIRLFPLKNSTHFVYPLMFFIFFPIFYLMAWCIDEGRISGVGSWFLTGFLLFYAFIISPLVSLSDGNMSCLYIIFSKKNIIVGKNLLFFKKKKRTDCIKITLNEYFFASPAARAGKDKYQATDWKRRTTKIEADGSMMIYAPVFILYKEHFAESFPWNAATNHPMHTHECFNAFADKVLDKDVILLDATYRNYTFLRQFYDRECFRDTRTGGKDILTQYEERLNKHKK